MKRRATAAQPDLDIEPHSGLRLGYLSNSLGYQLRLAEISAYQHFERRLTDFGVAPRYLGLLILIETNPGAAQSRLAEALDLDRSTLVPILHRLTREDFIERRPSAEDRRANGLWLTPKGTKTVAALKKLATKHDGQLLAGFSAEERAVALQLLRRITYNAMERD